MKIQAVFLLLSMVVWPPTESGAVSIDEDGFGQALIFPFWSAAQGNQTLLTIANDLTPNSSSTGLPTTLKIRVIGHIDGAELASFNVYLGAGDVWVAALHQENGVTQISTPDESCVFPLPQANLLSVVSQSIGSIEVIQMGSVTDEELASAINEKDCSSILERWTSDPWAETPAADFISPVGGVRGSLILINTEKGTGYSVPALALADFSDIIQHTNVGDETPNLSTAHDQGTDTAIGTTSTVCHLGACIEDHWSAPIDAVSAVLTAQELHGDFVIDETMAAKTEWVISYPTRRYSSATYKLISLSFWDREGNRGETQPCVPEDPSPYSCRTSYLLSHVNAIEVVSFGRDPEEYGQSELSDILGVPFIVDFPGRNFAPIPASGSARLGFEGALTPVGSDSRYFGIPVLGFGLQEYTNAFLPTVDGTLQRANYGNVLPLSRVVDISD